MRSVSVALNHENQSIHEHLAAALGLDAVTLAVALGPPRPTASRCCRSSTPLAASSGMPRSVGTRSPTAWSPMKRTFWRRSIGADWSTSSYPRCFTMVRGTATRWPSSPHSSDRGRSADAWPGRRWPPPSLRLPRSAIAASVPLAGGPYWGSLLERTKSLSDRTAAARARSAIDLLALRHGGSHDLALGRWHGDWAPWNMAPPRAAGSGCGTGSGPLLTDRSGSMRSTSRRNASPVGRPIDQSIVSEAIRRCSETLTALGMAGAVRSGLLAAVYPLELHLRYAESLSEHSDTGPVDVPPVPALVTA